MRLFDNFKKHIFLSCLLFTFYFSPIYGTIYDCFIFFNELELLEVRLNELDSVVDKFVLVEMNQTFQGKKKPFIFNENKHLFQRFLDKIIYIGISDPPNTSSVWAREYFQRDQIKRGLTACSDEDIILFSDVDEIPHHDTINKIIESLKKHSLVRCNLRMFRYFMNMESFMWDHGPIAAKYKDLKNQKISAIRRTSHDRSLNRALRFFDIPNTGWHFTSMGGLEMHKIKLESYSHTERNNDHWKSQEFIDKHLKDECRLVEIDDSFPAFMIDNLDKYKSWIYN